MTPPTPPPSCLDFASIRQQYPAAFAALDKWAETLPKSAITVEWLGLEYEMSSDITPYSVPTNPRELFDFFDEKGVFVMVNTRGVQRLPVWSYEIECENGGVYRSNYPTRTAAESTAFMAAFGKLEEMLKQEQG